MSSQRFSAVQEPFLYLWFPAALPTGSFLLTLNPTFQIGMGKALRVGTGESGLVLSEKGKQIWKESEISQYCNFRASNKIKQKTLQAFFYLAASASHWRCPEGPARLPWRWPWLPLRAEPPRETLCPAGCVPRPLQKTYLKFSSSWRGGARPGSRVTGGD